MIEILLFIMILLWQVIMWRKIELKKWQKIVLYIIMASLIGAVVYNAFIL